MTPISLDDAIAILKRTDLVRRASSDNTEPWKLSTHPDDDYPDPDYVEPDPEDEPDPEASAPAFLVIDPDDDDWRLRFTRAKNQAVMFGDGVMHLQSEEEDVPTPVLLFNQTPVGATDRVDQLYRALADTVGSEDPAELALMIQATNGMPISEAEKGVIVRSMRVLKQEVELRTTHEKVS